jgi:hypothetical protein
MVDHDGPRRIPRSFGAFCGEPRAMQGVFSMAAPGVSLTRRMASRSSDFTLPRPIDKSKFLRDRSELLIGAKDSDEDLVSPAACDPGGNILLDLCARGAHFLAVEAILFDDLAPPGFTLKQSWNALGMESNERVYIGFTSIRPDHLGT